MAPNYSWQTTKVSKVSNSLILALCSVEFRFNHFSLDDKKMINQKVISIPLEVEWFRTFISWIVKTPTSHCQNPFVLARIAYSGSRIRTLQTSHTHEPQVNTAHSNVYRSDYYYQLSKQSLPKLQIENRDCHLCARWWQQIHSRSTKQTPRPNFVHKFAKRHFCHKHR